MLESDIEKMTFETPSGLFECMDTHIGDKNDDETDLMKNEAHLCMMEERLMQMDCFFDDFQGATGVHDENTANITLIHWWPGMR